MKKFALWEKEGFTFNEFKKEEGCEASEGKILISEDELKEADKKTRMVAYMKNQMER